MYTNQNLIIVATIVCGLLSILAIVFNYLSKRERKIRVKDEQELIIAVKDSINAHTNQQVTDMEKRLLDMLDTLNPKDFNLAGKLNSIKQICLSTKENSDFIRKTMIEHKRYMDKLMYDYYTSLSDQIKATDKTPVFNDPFVLTEPILPTTIKEEIEKAKTHFDENLEERKNKKCMHCGNYLHKEEGLFYNLNRRFCKEKNGIMEYCKKEYNKKAKEIKAINSANV